MENTDGSGLMIHCYCLMICFCLGQVMMESWKLHSQVLGGAYDDVVESYSFSYEGAGVLVQWVKHLHCMQQTQVWSPASYMVAQALLEILESRARSNFWALPGVAQQCKQSPNEKDNCNTLLNYVITFL